MELMASDNSLLLDLSMQHVSIHTQSYRSHSAWAQVSSTFFHERLRRAVGNRALTLPSVLKSEKSTSLSALESHVWDSIAYSGTSSGRKTLRCLVVAFSSHIVERKYLSLWLSLKWFALSVWWFQEGLGCEGVACNVPGNTRIGPLQHSLVGEFTLWRASSKLLRLGHLAVYIEKLATASLALALDPSLDLLCQGCWAPRSSCLQVGCHTLHRGGQRAGETV